MTASDDKTNYVLNDVEKGQGRTLLTGLLGIPFVWLFATLCERLF